MSVQAERRRERADGARWHARLWIGVAMPLFVDLAFLQAGLSLSAWTCRHEQKAPLFACFAVALLVAIALLLGSWRNWARFAATRDAMPLERVEASRLLLLAGFGSSLLGFLLLLAFLVPVVVLHPCG